MFPPAFYVFLKECTGPDIMGRIVGAAHGIIANALSGAGSMNKCIVSNIYSNMTYGRSTGRIGEEHQIPGLQLRGRYLRYGRLILTRGGVGKTDVEMGIYILSKS